MGIDTSDIVSNEDLVSVEDAPEVKASSVPTLVAAPLLFDPNLEEALSLSSREINLAKRRARKQKLREAAASQSSLDENGGSGEGSSKRLKREDSLLDCSLEAWSIYSVGEGQWPLSAWVDILINDVFSPSWEIRHGASTALREVIKLHGNGGGREPGMTGEQSEAAHNAWIEDLALRLLSVLALDRFGDFVSDQVVAPVRETCSQCLGAVVSLMREEAVGEVVRILVELLAQEAWEVRHGALLGMKYIFAVRRVSKNWLIREIVQKLSGILPGSNWIPVATRFSFGVHLSIGWGG